MLMRRTTSLWPAFVFRGDSRWNVLHFSKTNGTYLNQEYSVRVKSTTFRYICLFADFCELFSLPQPDENCGISDMLFPVFAYLFGRNTGQHGSTRVKLRRPEKNQRPTWLRICSSGFSLVHAFFTVLLISLNKAAILLNLLFGDFWTADDDGSSL